MTSKGFLVRGAGLSGNVTVVVMDSVVEVRINTHSYTWTGNAAADKTIITNDDDDDGNSNFSNNDNSKNNNNYNNDNQFTSGQYIAKYEDWLTFTNSTKNESQCIKQRIHMHRYVRASQALLTSTCHNNSVTC